MCGVYTAFLAGIPSDIRSYTQIYTRFWPAMMITGVFHGRLLWFFDKEQEGRPTKGLVLRDV